MYSQEREESEVWNTKKRGGWEKQLVGSKNNDKLNIAEEDIYHIDEVVNIISKVSGFQILNIWQYGNIAVGKLKEVMSKAHEIYPDKQ